MGYRAKRFGITRVELEGGYWADVRRLTKEEDDDCQEALLAEHLESPLGVQVQQIKAKLHQRDYTDRLLLHAIQAWNLDDDDGNTLPIELEHIRGLLDADSTKLLGVVRNANAPLEEAGTKQG